MKRSIFAAVFIACLATLTGCVSLAQGTMQTITFDFQPKEISCVASRDGVDISSLTYDYNILRVSKSKGDILVLCAAPGYKRQTVRLKSETQAAGVVGGIFIDYGVTDMATGAMWRYPDHARVTLVRE